VKPGRKERLLNALEERFFLGELGLAFGALAGLLLTGDITRLESLLAILLAAIASARILTALVDRQVFLSVGPSLLAGAASCFLTWFFLQLSFLVRYWTGFGALSYPVEWLKVMVLVEPFRVCEILVFSGGVAALCTFLVREGLNDRPWISGRLHSAGGRTAWKLGAATLGLLFLASALSAPSQKERCAPGSSYNPFFLHGSVGLGKTHLLQAVAHRLQSTGVSNVIALSCASFTNEFIAALSSQKIDEFRKKYRRAGALLIDDIQFLCDKERTQEEFFHTFNEIYNRERQIFLTSDAAPSTIQGLSERLVSRFRLGLVVQMDPPDLETRMAIIHKKADQRGLELSADVVEVVARRIRDNVRELEGAVLRIESMVRHENRAITTSSVSETLDELFGGTNTRIDLRKIEELVCEEFVVTTSELHSARRTRSIVLPRQVCMYLGRRFTACSLGEIGQYFGGRDHSTVLHSIEKIRHGLPLDAGLRRSTEVIEEQLRRS
jgi:chromosomal replication initiator protein DnaA